MQRFKSNGRKRKIFLVTALIIILTCVVLAVLEKKQYINLYGAEVTDSQDDAKTTSSTKTAQEDFNEGEFREPGNSLNENEGTGSITDNNGSIGNDVDTSSPIVSSTGEITVYSPKSGATIKSGYALTGKSTLSKISYRLIDSVNGEIASGELNVVNGNFSGNIGYNTSATEGRLDIFATRDDYSEFSNVEIPIRFSQ